jgi:hypothetical protein
LEQRRQNDPNEDEAIRYKECPKNKKPPPILFQSEEHQSEAYFDKHVGYIRQRPKVETILQSTFYLGQGEELNMMPPGDYTDSRDECYDGDFTRLQGNFVSYYTSF